MHDLQHRSFDKPDETREYSHGRSEIVNMDRGRIDRLILEPGWRWSDDVKPSVGTETCQVPHFQYHVSGQLAVLLPDGSEMMAGPGDLTSLPEGHDAWVVGNEPVVLIDWHSATG